tara:strand:+ start:506 stop:679 length:174 start_codon:yes stop_codon:yes gene_type:complete
VLTQSDPRWFYIVKHYGQTPLAYLCHNEQEATDMSLVTADIELIEYTLIAKEHAPDA